VLGDWMLPVVQTLAGAAIAATLRYFWVLRRFSAFVVLRHPLVLLSRRQVRFSATAMLDCPSRRGDGIVLILSRPSSGDKAYWGPLGGVIKYSTEAEAEFRKRNVYPAREPSESDPFGRDLRVFVPGRQLLGFLSWFRKDEGREHFQTALQRELAEELIVSFPKPADVSHEEWERSKSEAGLALRYSQFDLAPHGRAMQMFRDGDVWQVRFFFVCRGHGDAFESLRMCIERAEGDYIATVARRAIDAGTYRGLPVGAHAQLLFADSVTRAHLPVQDAPPA